MITWDATATGLVKSHRFSPDVSGKNISKLALDHMQRNPPQIDVLRPILAVLVHVPAVQEAITWYERALPGAVRKQLSEPVPIEYLELGGVMLELVPADEKVANAAAGSVVYWNTPDFEASLWHLLNSGAVLYRGPGDIERGQRMCQVRDPWGNCIGLRGPVVGAVNVA